MNSNKKSSTSDGDVAILMALSPEPVTKLAALLTMSPSNGRSGWFPVLATISVLAIGAAVGMMAPHFL
jgi:hypothetical protein